LAQQTELKQQVQLQIQGEVSSLSAERQWAALEAIASLLKVPPDSIDLYQIYTGSIIFDLGVPQQAIDRLRSLLESNSPQLRLLGIEKVLLQTEADTMEEWARRNGKFSLISSDTPVVSVDARGKPKETFKPIRGIWIFHMVYLIVTIAIALSAFPHALFVSLLLISAFSAVGLLLAVTQQFMASQVLALAIGVGSPIIIFATLSPLFTVALFLLLTLLFATVRKWLF